MTKISNWRVNPNLKIIIGFTTEGVVTEIDDIVEINVKDFTVRADNKEFFKLTNPDNERQIELLQKVFEEDIVTGQL